MHTGVAINRVFILHRSVVEQAMDTMLKRFREWIREQGPSEFVPWYVPEFALKDY